MARRKMVSDWPGLEKLLYELPPELDPYSVEEYGKRLRELREEYGYSRQRVADFLGCTQQHIERIEGGQYKQICRKWVPVFAQLYECSCSYLLGHTDEKTGIWSRAEDGLYFPILQYRKDEILTVAAVVRAYNRDPELLFLYLELSKKSARKRQIYRDKMVKWLEMDDDLEDLPKKNN